MRLASRSLGAVPPEERLDRQLRSTHQGVRRQPPALADAPLRDAEPAAVLRAMPRADAAELALAQPSASANQTE